MGSPFEVSMGEAAWCRLPFVLALVSSPSAASTSWLRLSILLIEANKQKVSIAAAGGGCFQQEAGW